MLVGDFNTNFGKKLDSNQILVVNFVLGLCEF